MHINATSLYFIRYNDVLYLMNYIGQSQRTEREWGPEYKGNVMKGSKLNLVNLHISMRNCGTGSHN